jgi:hypothetical protein
VLLENIDHDRRGYPGSLARTIAGARLGVFGVARAVDRPSREFSGLDRATEWINSPPFTASSVADKIDRQFEVEFLDAGGEAFAFSFG